MWKLHIRYLIREPYNYQNLPLFFRNSFFYHIAIRFLFLSMESSCWRSCLPLARSASQISRHSRVNFPTSKMAIDKWAQRSQNALEGCHHRSAGEALERGKEEVAPNKATVWYDLKPKTHRWIGIHLKLTAWIHGERSQRISASGMTTHANFWGPMESFVSICIGEDCQSRGMLEALVRSCHDCLSYKLCHVTVS